MAAKGTSLRQYALTRLVLVVPMVLILLTLVFLLMRVAPGDPVDAALGGHAPPAVIAHIKQQLGFDKPLYVQYFEYLGDIARGNFGTAINPPQPVTNIIKVNGAATLELTFYAMIVAIVVGILVGLLAGRFRDTAIDTGGRLVLSGGLGGMGGAQPLAATMLGAAFLGVEIDPARIARRRE